MVTRTCVVSCHDSWSWNGIHWTTQCPPQHSDGFDHGYSQDIAALEHWIRAIWRISLGFSSSFVLMVSEASNIDDWTAWVEVNSLVRYLQDCAEMSLRRISFRSGRDNDETGRYRVGYSCELSLDSFIFWRRSYWDLHFVTHIIDYRNNAGKIPNALAGARLMRSKITADGIWESRRR